MKYEAVFGDQSLFDGAPEDVDMIGYSGGFYKNSPDGPMYCCGCTFTTDEYRNKGFIAMRRIIKEPKRWTWEDKKAGVLPDVGIKCVWVNLSGTEYPDDLIYPEVGAEIEIVATTKTYDGKYPVSVFKWLHDDGESQCYAASGHVEDFKPIETPAEKAQREEDEFVKSEMKNTTLSMEWSCVYERGLRAAYRKLKGGE